MSKFANISRLPIDSQIFRDTSKSIGDKNANKQIADLQSNSQRYKYKSIGDKNANISKLPIDSQIPRDTNC